MPLTPDPLHALHRLFTMRDSRILHCSAKFMLPLLVALVCVGCFLANIDANKDYQYVLWKGSPEKISAWTLTRGNVKEIDDGMAALQDILEGSLMAIMHHEPDEEKNLHLAEASIEGLVQAYRLAAATADGRGKHVPHYDISVGDASQIVRWMIEHAASEAHDGGDDVVSRKRYKLWLELEPEKSSVFHSLWERSREVEREKFKKLQGGSDPFQNRFYVRSFFSPLAPSLPFPSHFPPRSPVSSVKTSHAPPGVSGAPFGPWRQNPPSAPRRRVVASGRVA